MFPPKTFQVGQRKTTIQEDKLVTNVPKVGLRHPVHKPFPRSPDGVRSVQGRWEVSRPRPDQDEPEVKWMRGASF